MRSTIDIFLAKIDEVDQRYRKRIEKESDREVLFELDSRWMSERFKLEKELLEIITTKNDLNKTYVSIKER